MFRPLYSRSNTQDLLFERSTLYIYLFKLNCSVLKKLKYTYKSVNNDTFIRKSLQYRKYSM
jgi:hypothetical protein